MVAYLRSHATARQTRLQLQLRSGCAQLMMEVGRRMRLERHERLCPFCQQQVVEDATQFLCTCPAWQRQRSTMEQRLRERLDDIRPDAVVTRARFARGSLDKRPRAVQMCCWARRWTCRCEVV